MAKKKTKFPLDKVYRILEIAKQKQNSKFDVNFGVVGLEGSGKSNFILWCMDYLKGNSENVFLGQEEFLNGLSKIKDEGVYDFDEAGEGLFSRDFQNKLNKQLVKAFMVFRAKRLIGFLALPDFFLLDIYFRRHRLAGLFYVYARGRVKFYDRDGIRKICLLGERGHFIPPNVKPLFWDYFPEYSGYLKADYDKKKAEKIKRTMEALSTEKKEPEFDISNLIVKSKKTKKERENEEKKDILDLYYTDS